MGTMSFGQAIKTCFKKYCVFKGRARRSEYWYWTLFVILLSVGIEVLQGLLSLPARMFPEILKYSMITIQKVSSQKCCSMNLP